MCSFNVNEIDGSYCVNILLPKNYKSQTQLEIQKHSFAKNLLVNVGEIVTCPVLGSV